MILTESLLDERLDGWRREYGPSGPFHCGTGANTTLARLIDHQGFLPNSAGFKPVPIRTPADDVDAAVTEMMNMVGEVGRPNLFFRAAMVLRCEYLTPYDWPKSQRLNALGRIGMSMSDTTYKEALRFGRSHLRVALARGSAAAGQLKAASVG